MARERTTRKHGMLRRSLLKGSALATAASTTTAAVPAASREEPPFVVAPGYGEVQTTAGKVRGFSERGIYTYLGVPYGAPTDGQARFQPPGKPEPWSGVRDSMQYGPICPQPQRTRTPDIKVFFSYHIWERMDEDCLRLNIWTPGINDNKKRPVLVWLHQRGFFAGSGHERTTHGRNLAERGDVVVVTINHRLNLLGFLNLTNYGERYASSVNVGLLDMAAALAWVGDNIAGFGGDPANVTIFGQSGGGSKVNHLMAMPLAKGLFHRAVVQSPIPEITRKSSLEKGAEFADALVRKLGLTRSSIERIHQMTYSEVMDAKVAVERDWDRLGYIYPAADGKILPEDPFYAQAPDASADVPLMVGTPVFDRVPILSPDGESMTESELVSAVKEKHGPRADEILEVVRKTFPGEKPVDLWQQIRGTLPAGREHAVLQAARKAAQNAGAAYLYQFAWKTPAMGGLPRAFHSSEVPFVFYNTDRCARRTGGTIEARELAAKVSDAWVQFARTGNPNHPGLPEWPKFAADQEPTMVFDNDCEVKFNYDRAARRALKQG